MEHFTNNYTLIHFSMQHRANVRVVMGNRSYNNTFEIVINEIRPQKKSMY